MAARDTAPPPSAPRNGAYANASDCDLRELLARTVTRLELHLDESNAREDAIRANTAAVSALRGELADLTAAVLTVGGVAARLDERTKTLCEVHDAGFRELREDFASMREQMFARLRDIDGDIAAQSQTIVHVEEQTRGRCAEVASRMNTLEVELGEHPTPGNDASGSGLRKDRAVLMADFRQRTKGNALALGGGALASGPLAYALYEIAKLIWKLANGG